MDQGAQGDLWHRGEDPIWDQWEEREAVDEILEVEPEWDVDQVWIPYSMERVGLIDGCSQRSEALSHVTLQLHPRGSGATGGCIQTIRNVNSDLQRHRGPWMTFDLLCPLLPCLLRSFPSGKGDPGVRPCHHDDVHLCTDLQIVRW